jgi:hypothetical protein
MLALGRDKATVLHLTSVLVQVSRQTRGVSGPREASKILSVLTGRGERQKHPS